LISPFVDCSLDDGNIAKCRIGFAETISVTVVTVRFFGGTFIERFGCGTIVIIVAVTSSCCFSLLLKDYFIKNEKIKIIHTFQ
jgi:hypothetical protein